MVVENITCELERAAFTGAAYHVVTLYDADGDYTRHSVHCCENAQEAVIHVIENIENFRLADNFSIDDIQY